MSAKYYLYRNLHKGGFSVKQRGKVVGRGETIVMQNVEFRVSKAGSARAKRTQQRNVHAFAVADNYTVFGDDWKPSFLGRLKDYREVTYNPFHADSFFYKKSGKPVFSASKIVTKDGKLYVK